ncbi:hypothetical protein POP12_013 [Pectobacterium phage POP12]|nr:hypothetical protein POP12_013 [Pectobacterium phage POP12]
MKKLLILALFSGSVFASANPTINPVDDVCSMYKDNRICVEVVSDYMDDAYRAGESMAHLSKKDKIKNRVIFVNKNANMCDKATIKEQCKKFQDYLVEEFDAGIGLY